MAQQIITTGNVAGDGTGDPLRDAFTKINENFTELYSGNVQVTAANIRVYSVAGRDGNVVLTVNDVAQAASKAYVNSAIAANIANVTGSITDSLSANITAANVVISNHSARISTLESNAATQATAITNLINTKATIAYVDTSIGLALSSNAILANVAAVNANVAAANAAILLRANLTGANFSGNISANSIITSNYIRTDTYFVGGTEANQGLGQAWANPAALFFSDTSLELDVTKKYYQINLQNLDPAGSGDIVVTADDGNDANNFITMGMSGSAFVDAFFPSMAPHDGYVYVSGGNLDLQSNVGNVEIMAGNLVTGQITVTQSNIVKLSPGVVIQYGDGTIQSTAFGGNANITSINANVTAANAAITSLQANAATQALELDNLIANSASQGSMLVTLTANSATQAVSINNINANLGAYQTYANSNASVQASSINLINANIIAANINITTLLSNASVQALELDNLQTNAQAQQGAITVLQSNSAIQAVQIDLLNSNLLVANTNISTLTTNAATQATQITLLNSNVAASNIHITNLQSNAASQALDIDNLYANVNFYLANVASSNANIAAANARIIVIDANLGSISTNVSNQLTQINLLNANVTAANLIISTKANVVNGNITANYFIANANVKIASTLEVGNLVPINYPGLSAAFVGNVDSYYQVVIQNLNSGSGASGDIVITADDGNDDNKYFNIGMNSSGWSGNYIVPAGDTGLPEYPYDGYMNVIGGNALVRSDGNVFLIANTAVAGILKDGDFFVNNGLNVAQNASISGSMFVNGTASIGDTTINGNLIVNNNSAFSDTSITGNLTVGNLVTANYLTLTNSIVANSISSTSNASITDNLTVGNLVSANYLTLSNFITANGVFCGGDVSISGNTSTQNITVSANAEINSRLTVNEVNVLGNIVIVDGLNVNDIVALGNVNISGNVLSGNIGADNLTVFGQINYIMGNVSHWSPAVSNVAAALDQIAARLYALENP
jgi:hypothetical protein